MRTSYFTTKIRKVANIGEERLLSTETVRNPGPAADGSFDGFVVAVAWGGVEDARTLASLEPPLSALPDL